jgi:hypothetical protein
LIGSDAAERSYHVPDKKGGYYLAEPACVKEFEEQPILREFGPSKQTRKEQGNRKEKGMCHTPVIS